MSGERKTLDEMAVEQGIDTTKGLHDYQWPFEESDWDGFAESINETRQGKRFIQYVVM